MRILKKLNNNAILSKDSTGHEIIVTGRGIAFNKNVYDEIDESADFQVYVPKGKDQRNAFETLVQEIPFDYFIVAFRIKRAAEGLLNTALDEGFTLRLADHIHFSVQRSGAGAPTPNLMLNEIKRFYRKEYQIGLSAIDLIKADLGIQLNEDEAGFIAFHIIASEEGGSRDDLEQIMRSLKVTIGMIEDHFNIALDTTSADYDRLVTHLRFFFDRARLGNRDNESLAEDQLYIILCDRYPQIVRFLDKLALYVDDNFHYQMGDRDRMYLIIHLARTIPSEQI